MATDNEIGRRNATIVRLRGLGWSLRRIAADRRVQMSHVGVQRVLDWVEATSDGSDGEVDALLLYRGAFVEQRPVAVAAWGQYARRADVLMADWTRDRHGMDLPELGFYARTKLRAETNAQAIAEL
jgi:hypothetical protein